MLTALLLSALLQQTPALPLWIPVHAAESLLLNHTVSIALLGNMRVWDRSSASFRNPEGAEIVRRSEFTLVHFWADYCASCLDELPALHALIGQLSKKYGTRIRILFVTETLGPDEMKHFLERNPHAFPAQTVLYQDTAGGLFDSLRESLPASRSPQLPATLLLDNKGIIRQAIIGSSIERKAELFSAIERIIESNTEK